MALTEQMTIHNACPTAHSYEVSSLELASVREREREREGEGRTYKRKQHQVLVNFSSRFTEQVD